MIYDNAGSVSIEATVDTAARVFLSVSFLAMVFALQRSIIYQGANIYAALAVFLGKIIGAIITI
ncbi:MAG: hypothetical protein OI715_00135 (plasmid) [Candidatus Methanoperedens sp.]|nr:MAG: hypothetical protein OI715_00135 [Candidatus Methanoperedens sp.]